MTVTIEYLPLFDGLIEIVSVDITEHAEVTAFQQRESKRRKHPKTSTYIRVSESIGESE